MPCFFYYRTALSEGFEGECAEVRAAQRTEGKNDSGNCLPAEGGSSPDPAITIRHCVYAFGFLYSALPKAMIIENTLGRRMIPTLNANPFPKQSHSLTAWITADVTVMIATGIPNPISTHSGIAASPKNTDSITHAMTSRMNQMWLIPTILCDT